MRLRIVDIETSGLAPPAEICEIAFIDVDEAGKEMCRFQSFVRPFGEIPSEARAVHHIGPDDVVNAPRWEQLLWHIKHVPTAPSLMVAHNAAFEKQWLERDPASAAPIFDCSWLCTYKAALRIWPEAPSWSLQVLRYWLALDVPADPDMPAHRALQDVVVTAALLQKMIGEGIDIETMIRWETEYAIFPRIMFGKFKGKTWPEVDRDYLRWMLSTDFDEDRKFCARRELERRGL